MPSQSETRFSSPRQTVGGLERHLYLELAIALFGLVGVTCLVTCPVAYEYPVRGANACALKF